MWTSYQRTKPRREENTKAGKENIGSINDNIDLQEESLQASLRDAYVEISESVIESRKQQELKDYSKALEAQANASVRPGSDPRDVMPAGLEGTDSGEASQEEQEILEKQRKKKKRRIIIVSSIIAVIIVAFAGFLVYRNFFAPDSSVGAIESRIHRLYTSEDMVDIKEGVTQQDLDNFYLELLNVQDKGDDVDSALEEIDTIGYFLSDKATLERYSKESYDLTTTGMMDSVEDIRENAQNYSVPGLALTINDMAVGIEDDYNSFIDLRSELNGVVDPLNFDEDGYQTRIEAISHVPNRTELEATYDKILVDKQAAIAQQELQDAQDEQARQEAQQALAEAQELQRQTQQELEETRRQLEEAAQKAAQEELERERNSGTVESVEPTVDPTVEATQAPSAEVTIVPSQDSSELEDNIQTNKENTETAEDIQ